MTDRDRGLLRSVHTLEQQHAKLMSAHYAIWKRGDRLRCLDDSNGAHFLKAGEVFTLDHVQPHCETGEPILFLVGACIGWEPERFERVD